MNQNTSIPTNFAKPPRPRTWLILILTGVGGCQLFEHDADSEVYKLIEKRQQASLGTTSNVQPDQRDWDDTQSNPYRFVPHPVDDQVPQEFRSQSPVHSEPAAPNAPDQNTETTEALTGDPQEMPQFGQVLSLANALNYATIHSREYQDAKEDLYLQALALTLERHLWTPRFVSNLQATYQQLPKTTVPDRALEAIASLAVEQRLPYGGQVVAQWVGTMMRDIENRVTNSESGTAILRADIPLLRGAGPTAFESRYQAERDLIYAVRTFENFRRSFLTRVAADYFDLLSAKTSISNALAGRDSSRDNWQRSQALADAERVNRQEADRARVDFLQARNRVINAIESFESSLDEFKILIGMPAIQAIDVTDEGLDLPEPAVDESVAIQTALRCRLDLLTTLDRVDDARRAVNVAKNNLLPDLALSGSVAYGTKDDHLSSFDFREDTETWTVGGNLELPLDRKAERNSYRSALINQQRAQRAHDQTADRVRLEVRRALRQIRQARFSLAIQEENIRSNQIRREAAYARFELGQISNRDVVDADNDLRAARDDYANAQSTLRRAILQFRLATGTLRVDDQSQWINP